MNETLKEVLKEIAVKAATRHGSQLAGGGLIVEGLRLNDGKMIAGGALLSGGAFAWSAIRKIARARRARASSSSSSARH